MTVGHLLAVSGKQPGQPTAQSAEFDRGALWKDRKNRRREPEGQVDR
jgi:hypothetical protein